MADEALQQRVEKHSIPEPNSGCWLWTATYNRVGYGGIKVAGTMTVAHRASWQAFKGPIPIGAKVLHKCDNRACCNPAHLFLGTQQDNMDDMRAKGRSPDRRGARNGRSKLTTDQVRDIRSSVGTNASLAIQYGVAHQLISRIRRGEAWSDTP
jgi:hypothetical protein